MNLYHYVCTYKNTTIEGDVEASSMAAALARADGETCAVFREYCGVEPTAGLADWPDRKLKVVKTMESVL